MRLLSFLLLLGCSSAAAPDAPEGQRQSLVDNSAWSVVAEPDDPFRALSPDAVPCPATVHGPDDEMSDLWYSVETRTCNYLSVGQPLLDTIDAGSRVRLRIYHFVLIEGTGYHLSVAMGDPAEVVGQIDVQGPSQTEQIVHEWLATRTYAKGETVIWNVRNDGANTWSMVDLEVMGP